MAETAPVPVSKPMRDLAFAAAAQAVRDCPAERRVALILLDLDDFSEVNLSMGLDAGDAVLREVSERLQSVLRPVDGLFRIGDDEFAILLPGVLSEDHATLAAQKVRTKLDEPFHLNGETLRLAASLGIALYPEYAPCAEDLFRCATTAMATAKQEHLGYVLCRSRPNSEEGTPIQYASRLRRAIDERELVVHYQPKYDVRAQVLRGAEALIRWPKEQSKLAMPSEFIQVAENFGLIGRLTEFVLNAALSAASRWRSNLSVSVNLSMLDLEKYELPALVKRALRTWQIRPERLILEVTETDMMRSPGKTINVMNELADIGTLLAIDDFGTGYSSLQYLQKLPVHELKIDKEFVSQMSSRESDEVIVRAIVSLAHNFGLAVTAEGVETEDSLHMLEKMGCDMAQGFFLSRPIPEEEFRQRFAA